MRTLLLMKGLILLLSSSLAMGSNNPLQKYSANKKPDKIYTGPEGNTILIYEESYYQPLPTQYSPAIGVNSSGGSPVIVTSPPNANTNKMTALPCTTEIEMDKNGKVLSKRRYGSGCAWIKP